MTAGYSILSISDNKQDGDVTKNKEQWSMVHLFLMKFAA
jgi:hypothetical protein